LPPPPPSAPCETFYDLLPGTNPALWSDKENFYQTHNRGLVDVRGDGTCFQKALEMSLCCDHGMVISTSFINHSVYEEVEDNKAFYQDFHVMPKDWEGDMVEKVADMMHQTALYMANREYRRDIVDVLIMAAANALKIKIGIFQKDHLGRLNYTCSGQRGLGKTVFLELYKQHYKSVIKKDYESPHLLSPATPSFKYIREQIPMAETEMSDTVMSPPQSVAASSDNPPVDLHDLGIAKEVAQEPTDYSDKASRAKFPLHLYEDLEPTEVEKCPPDINGFKFYKVQVREDWLKAQRDRRHFTMNSSKPCKENIGLVIQKSGRCSGSHYCTNRSCDYRFMAGKSNSTQWERKRGQPGKLNCFTCGAEAEREPCPARKLVQYHKYTKELLIFHINQHSCQLQLDTSERDAYYKQVIQENPGLSVSALQEQHVTQSIQKKDMQGALARSEMMADTTRLRAMKTKLKRAGRCDSRSQSVEAMLEHKQLMAQHDNFLLYSFNMKSMSKELPSYAFKTCKSALQLAMVMNVAKPGKQPMKKEVAFFDGQHSRVKDFITLALYTTMGPARKIVCLARMEAKSESAVTVGLFFYQFNKALKEFSGNEDEEFNPAYICSDMAPGIMNGIQQAFSYAFYKEKVIGCQQHYFSNMAEHAASLPVKEKTVFMQLSQAAVRAKNVIQYNQVFTAMKEIAEQYPKLRLAEKVDWWHFRRYLNADVFRGHDAKKTNQAEAGHSSFPTRGGPKWLVEACQLDAARLMLQTQHIDKFLLGTYRSTGRAPNQQSRILKDRQAQMESVKQFAKVMDSIKESQDKGEKHIMDASSDEEEGQAFLPSEADSFKAKTTLQKVFKSQVPKKTIPEMLKQKKVGRQKKLLAADVLEKHLEAEEFIRDATEQVNRNKEAMKAWATAGTPSSDDDDDPEVVFDLTNSPTPKKRQKRSVKKKSDHATRKPKAADYKHLERQDIRKLNPSPLHISGEENAPFLVVLNNANIKKCQGCRVPIQNPAREPDNLVFTLLGYRPYHTEKGFKDRISPCYFHADLMCLQNFDPSIQDENITMEVGDYLDLTKQQLKKLANEGLLEAISSNIKKLTGRNIHNFILNT
jgi:hypothetical protein